MLSASLNTRLSELIDRLDLVLIALAILNVGLYLLALLSVWDQLGVAALYESVMRACDVIFLIDLGAKLVVQRRRYLRSPWFMVDLLSCLPVLSTVAGLSFLAPGVRFIRVFRVLRSLRLLRATRSLEIIGAVPEDVEALASPRLRRGVAMLTVLYAAAMVGLSEQIHRLSSDQQQADFMEASLILGSLMGISLTLMLMQLQIPEMATARIRALMQVALPDQIVARMVRDPDIYRRTSRQPATVIFCDIIGFTRTVERLDGDLDTLKAHLERALDVVTDAHLGHNLVIDKFIGDAVMAFRGGELVEGTAAEHAAAVVRSALDAHNALRSLQDPYFHDIKIGGASAEAALIGSFGTRRRLTYTVLGDRVNLAARLESAVKQCGTRNLFCERTHTLTATRTDIRWRRFGRLKVPGKQEVVVVYEALDPAWEDDWGWLDDFHAGLDRFEAGDFPGAAERFAAADTARPGGDVPSQRYRQRALDGDGGAYRTEK